MVRAPTLSLAEDQLPVPAGPTRTVAAPVPWVLPALSRGGVGNRWGHPVEGSKLHLRTSSLLEPRYPTAGAADQAVSERPSVSSATTRGLVLRGQQGCRSPEDRSELCPHAPKQARHGLPGPTEGHPQTTPATSCQDPPGDAPKPRQPPPARAHRGTPHHVQGLAHQHTHTCTFPRTRSQAHTHSLAGRGMTPLLGDVHRTPLGVKADVVPPSEGGGPVAGRCRVAPDLHVGL